jgi:hypothetical protein
VKPTWASSADNATVEAADDGLTATVTLTGIGTVIITATVNDVEGTYTISTSSAFESAAGYWTFEDPANLGKATIGTDLTELAAVKSVEGPSATKNAVQVDPQTPALKWMHNLTIADTEYEFMWHEWHKYKIANTFTVLFDVRPVEQWDMDRLASPLYYAENIREDEVENGVTYGFQAENAAFWVRSMDEVMKLYANGNQWSFDPFTPEKKAAKPWYRIVIKVWPALQTDPDADPTNHEHAFHRELWIDGKLVNDDLRGDNTYYRVGMFENSPVWFLTGSPGNHTEYDEQKGKYVYDIPMPCSTIAVWDKLLSDDEIASLGGVSK